MDVQTRLNSPEYKNWLKMSQGLLCVKNGLCTFAKDVSNDVHKDIWKKAQCVPTKCGKCQPKKYKFNNKKWDFEKKSSSCPNDQCAKVMNAIAEQHNNGSKLQQLWKNADFSKWHDHPWEISKVYMLRGQKHNTGPEQCDSSNMLNFFQHCKLCKKYFKNFKNISPVIQIRNDLMHSSNLEVKNNEMNDAFKRMVELLEDENINTYPETTAAIRELNELKRMDINLTSREWREKEIVFIRDRIEEFETRLSCIESKQDKEDERDVIESSNGLVEFLTNNDDIRQKLDKEFQSFKKTVDTLDQRVEVLESRVDGLEAEVRSMQVVNGGVTLGDFNRGTDYKSHLNTYAQPKKLEVKWDEFRREGNNNWFGRVIVDGQVYESQDSYLKKQEAHREAAYQALHALGYYGNAKETLSSSVRSKAGESSNLVYSREVSSEKISPITSQTRENGNLVYSRKGSTEKIQKAMTMEAQPNIDSAEMKDLNDFLRSLGFEAASSIIMQRDGKFQTAVTIRVTNVISLEESVKGKKQAEQTLARNILAELGVCELSGPSSKEVLHAHCGKNGLDFPNYVTYEDQVETQHYYCMASSKNLTSVYTVLVQSGFCSREIESVTAAAKQMIQLLHEVRISDKVVGKCFNVDSSAMGNPLPSLSLSPSPPIGVPSVSTSNTANAQNSTSTKNYVSILYECCQKLKIDTSMFEFPMEESSCTPKQYKGKLLNFKPKFKLPILLHDSAPANKKEAEKQMAARALSIAFNITVSKAEWDRSKNILQEECVQYKLGNVPKYQTERLEIGFSSEVEFEVPVKGRNWFPDKQGAKLEVAEIALDMIGN